MPAGALRVKFRYLTFSQASFRYFAWRFFFFFFFSSLACFFLVFSPGVMARRKDEKRYAKRRNNETRGPEGPEALI